MAKKWDEETCRKNDERVGVMSNSGEEATTNIIDVTE